MTAVTLPLAKASTDAGSSRLQLHAPTVKLGARLPRVERVSSQGALLGPSPLGTADEVLSLALTRTTPLREGAGEEPIYLHSDVAERLQSELAARKRWPRAVHVSPSVDPFAPLTEVQEATASVVEVLAAHGLDAWLMTAGFLRPGVLARLAACRERVRLTLRLTTLDRSLQRKLEPWTAPPRMRLRQLVRLRAQGFRVQVALEPLVPGLTDTRSNLKEVLEALARVGVRHVTAGYLVLRGDGRDPFLRNLEPEWADGLLAAYDGGPLLPVGRGSPVRYLAKARRQRGYAALMALASELGITVGVCRASNPDFQVPRAVPSGPRQQLLPQF